MCVVTAFYCGVPGVFVVHIDQTSPYASHRHTPWATVHLLHYIIFHHITLHRGGEQAIPAPSRLADGGCVDAGSAHP